MAETPRQIISDLEAAAVECDLISQLSPAKNVQLSNKDLCAQFLDVANDLKHPEAIASERRIKAGKELVARQRGIVARLERHGYPTDTARQPLTTLEQTLALFEQNRGRFFNRKP